MDNEHTTITGRQANPSRPEQINSLSINGRSLFSVFLSSMSFTAPTFSICQTVKRDECKLSLERSSWGNTVAGVLTETSNMLHMPMSLTHCLSHKHFTHLLILISWFSFSVVSLVSHFLSEWQLDMWREPHCASLWHNGLHFLATPRGTCPSLASLSGNPGKSLTWLTGSQQQTLEESQHLEHSDANGYNHGIAHAVSIKANLGKSEW